jgi:hypothetical protein
MIALTLLRELDVATPTATGRLAHLSAASGLVCIGALAYVIADDELHLGVFRTDTSDPGRLIRLFDGTLPEEPKARKKKKPDTEAIVLLPADRGHPNGSLLVLGSGSRPNRQRGIMLALDANGDITGAPLSVDLSPIYAPLYAAHPELNIEGAVVLNGEMWLLQRGNKGAGRNLIVRFALDDFLGALRPDSRNLHPIAIDDYVLGDIDGVPLSFTDATVLPDGRLIFTAAAEDTDDAYYDGGSLGSAIGFIESGKLSRIERVAEVCKIEGIHARPDGDTIRLLLVTDADDADIPAQLLTASLD